MAVNLYGAILAASVLTSALTAAAAPRPEIGETVSDRCCCSYVGMLAHPSSTELRQSYGRSALCHDFPASLLHLLAKLGGRALGVVHWPDCRRLGQRARRAT